MLSGLSRAGIRQVNYALRITCPAPDDAEGDAQGQGNDDVASVFLRLLRVIDKLSQYIDMEMEETHADLAYWNDLAESVEVAGSLEIFVARVHAQLNPYQLLFSHRGLEPPSSETALLLTAEESIYKLSNAFQSLCVFLARLRESNDWLKKVHDRVQHKGQQSLTINEVYYLQRDATAMIERSLDTLFEATEIFLPLSRNKLLKQQQQQQQSIIEGCRSLPESGSKLLRLQQQSILEKCHSLEICVASLDKTTKQGRLFANNRYPIGLNALSDGLRRPPDWQRRWVGDALSLIFGAAAASRFLKNWRLNVVQEKVSLVMKGLQALWLEYAGKAVAIVGVLAKATSRSESIITESEVLDARANLSRALNKWADTETGKRWMLQYFKQTPKGSVPELEAQIGGLRMSFEKDIESPFWGMVKGNMAGAIFIQGIEMTQKMMELMLQADLAISNNQLTMIITSIVPVFVFAGLVWYAGKNAVYPIFVAPGEGPLRILQELEHNLIVVYSLLEAERATEAERRLGFTESPIRKSSLSLFSPLPSLPSPAEGASGGFPYNPYELTEQRLEVARGQLCFDLLRLRRKLNDHFLRRTIFSRLYHAVVEPLTVFSFLPFRLIYRLWAGKSARRDGTSEYTKILKDLLYLETRDEELSQLKVKLSVIARLKLNHSCFCRVSNS